FGRPRLFQHRKYFDKCKLSQTDNGCTATGLFVLEPDANINGPVYIPKLYDGRNKTFFMFAYQKYIESKPSRRNTPCPRRRCWRATLVLAESATQSTIRVPPAWCR